MPGVLDAATLRPLDDLATGEERFTQARVERILALVVALGCAVLGTQSFLNALGSEQESAAWHPVLLVLAFGSLAFMLVALVAGVLVRTASGICAVALVAVIACWPFATGAFAAGAFGEAGAAPGVPEVLEQPWIWYLLNVASAAAVMAFRLPLQVIWAVGVPVLYAAARVAQLASAGELSNADHGSASAALGVGRDAVFAAILAGVIIALGWLLRSVAVALDRARRDAVASYAAAADADAAETERVAVAALMHDSVLAALIAAERASTPREEALAVAMAREALTRLANAELDVSEGPDAPVSAASVVVGIERAAAELGLDLTVAARTVGAAAPIPGRVARAVVLAATQAIANSVQHAGARGLVVDLHADGTVIAVRIADTGGGFAPGDVAADRLGIRGSIVARMAAAGGRARIQTGPSGTTVRLDWEAPR